MITWRDRFYAFMRNCRRDPAAAWVELALLAGIAALILVLCSCAKERGQAAADNRARVQAAQINLAEVMQAVGAVRGILKQQFGAGLVPGLEALDKAFAAASRAQALSQNADSSMPAVAEVPSADFPAPVHSATELAVHPEIDAPAPEPKGTLGRVLAIGGTGLMGALFLVGRLAPGLIPGAGPLVGGIANLAWSALAHRDQKQADTVATTIAGAAQDALPIVAAVQMAPPEDLPPWLRGVLTEGRRAAAVQLLQAAAKVPAAG